VLRIGNLGGKFGEEVAAVFDTDKVCDIRKYSEDQLRAKLGPEQGSWVYNICQGIDYSEINPRTKIKSMLRYLHTFSCSDYSAKNFQPALNTSESAARWLRVLTADLAARLHEDEDHRLPRTITIHHRHGGSTKSRQSQLPMTKAMDKEFLFTHVLSLWRGIETEGRAFPANTISVAISGFGDVEDGIQGIQGFLIPGKKISDTATPILGKRKEEDYSGIEKFFSKKEDSHLETGDAMEEDEDMRETYLCPQCSQHIPLEEVEIHHDYHIALELSEEFPARSTSNIQAKPRVSGKEEKKRPIKKIKQTEKGQRTLSFGSN
jgi:DNA polymerase eta